MTGNRADAAELMQDAFLKLWERWDRIDRIDDRPGYLFLTPRAARALGASSTGLSSMDWSWLEDQHPTA